ncbi:MAG TPA: isoprenylcysteine carboxylmethyltransferase family protein [Terriglobales bacterium]|jgi:protein-S-isoprenylcysteine O-methyltransferase Ste14|nr:isoprenylcysteine carboxylmethyltransferase family protein [Terriglobales bacterium]
MTSRKDLAAALLASAWALPAAVLAGLLATRFALWTAPPPLLLGSPAWLLAARAVFLGAALALLLPRARLGWLYALAVAGDATLLYFTGLLRPLSAGRVVFEGATVALCVLPAQLFARWTREDRRLEARAWLHFLFHSALLLGVLPGLLVALGGGDWHAAYARSALLNKLYLQLLLIPAILLVSASQEFVGRGRGTPMPADPPRRLVTSGVYSYVANPMQAGKLGVLAGWGLFWWNPWIVAAALAGALYSVLVATPREERALCERFPEAWPAYRRQVRRWWPRWRPYHPAQAPERREAPARLYLDLDCGSCSQLAEWLRQRRPVGLVVCGLSEHAGGALGRMTYEAAEGAPEEGVAALARALEHVHLGWAFCGWMMRLPGISVLAQLVGEGVSARTERPRPSCPSTRVAEEGR